MDDHQKELLALAALTSIAAASQEAAALAQRLQELSDTVAAAIDALAPATGHTVEDVFEPFFRDNS